jgi:hypothetical protein
VSAWKERCTRTIAAITEQARVDGASYEELRDRIAAAYPYDANERDGVNRNWRRIAQWYLSVYANERLIHPSPHLAPWQLARLPRTDND